MKKGFTLIEVIAVISLLAIILLIAYPTILKTIGDTKDQISDATIKLIGSATDEYMEKNNYSTKEGDNHCIELNSIVNGGFLKTPLKDIVSGKDIDLSQKVKVTITKENNILKKVYELTNKCN